MMNERGRQLSAGERAFFASFFQRLDDASIATVLLRNYWAFPEKIGHDLDVFFRRADLPRARACLLETLRESGGEMIHVHERDYVLAVWFRAGRNEPETLHFDFYHGAFTWHGLAYLSEEELLASAQSFRDFNVPRPAHEAINLFLTSLLWGGFFKERYRERIESLLEKPEETAEFLRLLDRGFGEAARRGIIIANGSIRIALGAPASDGISARRYASLLRKSFKRRSLARRAFLSCNCQIRYWLKEFATTISTPGICIAVLGPDGSGKSTVIQAVKERIEYFFGEVVDRHWRPQLLRDAGVMVGSRKQSVGPVTNPHGRRPHSAGVSALRLCYYWLDYWLGWPAKVWKFKAKNHLVVFDRYAQDMCCDPHRYRLGLPRGAMRIVCGAVPKPDLTFVLLADAETIHKRKGEVPLESLRRLLANYGDLAKSGGRIHAVDCGRAVKDVADEIARISLNHLQTRLERSWK